MTLATKITFVRILFMPLFLFLLAREDLSFAAGAVFFFLGLTDLLDGIIARTKKQKSLLGTLLDPVADKLLLSSAYLILALTERVPFWFFFIVAGRDLLIIFGGVIIYFFVDSNSISPRFLGKTTSVIQSLTIFVVIFSLPLKNYLIYLTALVTLLSGIDYFLVSGKRIIYRK